MVVQLGNLEERRRSMSLQLYGLDQDRFDGLEPLDEIVLLAREVLAADGAAVNLLVGDQQVTVASSEGRGHLVSRAQSVCSTVLETHHGPGVIEIEDMRDVPALAHNPVVDGSVLALRFYAAAPLVGKHGLALGTLCAWSAAPGHLDDRQRGMLRQFGRSVVNVLDERRRALVADQAGALRPAR